MRRKVLYNSVVRQLKAGEQVEQLVYLWSRHRLMVPYCAAAGLALFVVAWTVGVETWTSRVLVGLGGVAVAALATSDYRVLVQTDRSLVMMQASRFRQVATGGVEPLARDTPMELVGTTLVITEWMIGGRQYSVMKRFQQAMVTIAAQAGAAP